MKAIDSIMKQINIHRNSLKKHHLLFALTLLLLSMFLTNCGPDERTTLFIDQKTKDYVVFRTGSWWAYQEQASNAIDTVSVIGYESAIEFWEDFASENFEQTRLSLKWSSFGHDLTKANPFLLITADHKTKQNKGVVEEQYPWFLYPNIVFLPFDSIGDNRWIWDYDTLRYEQFYDSLEVQNKMYYEVMEISTTNNVHPKKQHRIWWAKHVGRIRWKTFGGEYWELTDYDIMQ